jgi:hypothetical protein
MATKKNPAAVALGALGGAKKVPKGTAMMSEEKRREVALAGVEARRKKAAKRKRGAK